MTSASSIKSINCTSCGAGLDVLGGGRVQVHVCGYCGAELDAQHNYKILKEFGNLVRPDSPFSIGMQGDIQGVSFTVIGTLGVEEHYGGRVWRWTDHQVFSPTHGYAYLSVEDGHFTFTRRLRHPTQPAWMSVQGVETAEAPPTVISEGGRYQYFDTSTSKITFVEGEFNWQPEIGQRSTTISAMSHSSMLGFEQSSGEEEISKTVYLPFTETCLSFGIDDLSGPTGLHALLPYRAGRHEGFLKWASTGFCFVAFILFLVLSAASGGNRLVSTAQNVATLPLEISFEITEVNRLAKINVSADVSNSWAYLGMFVTDPEDVPVFETGRTVERYHGRDGDGAWSEGSGRGVVRFTPKVAGEYTLELSLDEAETWSRDGSPVSNVKVSVAQGVSAPSWMAFLALAFFLFSGFQHARVYIHQRRRWWGTDWTDD
jgi:hypothetical protein